jgi:hypothetical protein
MWYFISILQNFFRDLQTCKGLHMGRQTGFNCAPHIAPKRIAPEIFLDG